MGSDLRTSDARVWAAGDCCALRPEALGPNFFQMRLWTQARLMGAYAAQCMLGRADDGGLGFAFELVRRERRLMGGGVSNGSVLLSIAVCLALALAMTVIQPLAHTFDHQQHAASAATLNAGQFTHATRFLGKRVVLLGLYNGQRLDAEPASDIVTYSRALDERTPASTFVRALLLRGRVRGAVLIGDTGLEEAFENLILDGLDVGGVGPALLDPDVELDHVFD